MRRFGSLLLGVVMMLGSVAGFGGIAAAQDATPDTESAHPFIGTWVMDTQPQNPDNSLTVGAASSDGTYVEASPDGIGIGVWEPTGETSAIMTVHYMTAMGLGIIRVEVDVAADGQTFSGQWTVEFYGPDGQTPGEAGPGIVEGTRMAAEAPGTPVMSLEDLFGGFEQATPEG